MTHSFPAPISIACHVKAIVPGEDENAKQLARLIAAGPELLTLLQALLKYSQSCEQCGNDFFEKGEAIRKDAHAFVKATAS